MNLNRMYEAHSFPSFFLLINAFWKLRLKQICVKSAGAVENKLIGSCDLLLFNLQQLYLKAPASHTVPLLLAPSQVFTQECGFFFLLKKKINKRSVIKMSVTFSVVK